VSPEEQLKAIAALHIIHGNVCVECLTAWPCQTRVILDGDSQ